MVAGQIDGAQARKAIALRSLGYVKKNGEFWITGTGVQKWVDDGIITLV